VSLGSQIRIIAEDDWFRVIFKPQGLSTMGGEGETLIHSDYMLLPNWKEDNVKNKKAVPCHRLDSATGGLVVCSKQPLAERYIKMAFANKDVTKRYRAIVPGRLEPPEGEITLPLSGQSAISKYKVAEYTRSLQYGWVTTLDLWPVTGRRHQLRKHLQLMGHSILGDTRYSFASSWPRTTTGSMRDYAGRMFLFSLSVSFPHPEDKHKEEQGGAAVEIRRVEVSIDEPEYFEYFRRFSQEEFNSNSL